MLTRRKENFNSTFVQLKDQRKGSRLTDIEEPLMNEAQASRFLGISRMTLLRKRNAGEINFFRVGFRVLYSKEKHLLPFLERCKREAKNK